ncbi:hypothetical protein DFH09DRAFT_1108485 [Mycena vulgaris]|nr:hypothetical protein DFH09DRAFT_1108485 [Mycena vulgaris]
MPEEVELVTLVVHRIEYDKGIGDERARSPFHSVVLAGIHPFHVEVLGGAKVECGEENGAAVVGARSGEVHLLGSEYLSEERGERGVTLNKGKEVSIAVISRHHGLSPRLYTTDDKLHVMTHYNLGAKLEHNGPPSAPSARRKVPPLPARAAPAPAGNYCCFPAGKPQSSQRQRRDQICAREGGDRCGEEEENTRTTKRGAESLGDRRYPRPGSDKSRQVARLKPRG